MKSPPQGVLATETWTERAFLKRVHDRGWLAEEVVERHGHASDTVSEKHRLGRRVENFAPCLGFCSAKEEAAEGQQAV